MMDMAIKMAPTVGIVALCAGLEDKETTVRFAGEMKGLEGSWSTMKAAQRADVVGHLINARLRDIGVPPVKIKMDEMRDTTNGYFEYADWTLKLNERRFGLPELTPDEFSRLTNTVYHEARHAEQWYLIARLMSEQGESRGKLAKETAIPSTVCKAAAKAPPLSDSQRDVATSFYDSVFGAHSEHRDGVLNKLGRYSEDIAAVEARANDPNLSEREQLQSALELRDLYELAEKNQRAYRALPEEKDAHEVGDAAGEAYLAVMTLPVIPGYLAASPLTQPSYARRPRWTRLLWCCPAIPGPRSPALRSPAVDTGRVRP